MRDRIVELVRVRAGDLLEHPRNWRRHPERQASALHGLLERIGYADALVARRVRGRLQLIDGHLRKRLDPDQVVPVLVVDLTAKEAETLLATLDPLAALARPDPPALAELLAGIEAPNEAVADLLEDLARQAGLPLRPASGPEELPVSPPARTRPGDLFMLSEHRLLCGDARSAADLARLMGDERADLVVTDPPYGVDYVGKTPRALRIEGDAPDGLAGLLQASFAAIGEVLVNGAPIYVFSPAGANSVTFARAFVEQGWRLHQTLIWAKGRPVLGHGDYHYAHEPILYGYAPARRRRGRGASGWYGGNDRTSVLSYPRPAASREHPTAKPVELVSELISNSSRSNQVVLDPFAGSGPVLVACELLGRRARAIEADPRYCDLILARWEALTGTRARRARARSSA